MERGVLYMILASFTFAIMGAFAKECANYMSSVEVVFFRNVFGVLIIGFTLFKSPLRQSGGKFWLLVFRGVMGFLALLAFFYNLAHIPMAEAMTFSKTAPIFTALLAALFLKEQLKLQAWVALFIGFIGIVFILNPSANMLSKTNILGLFSGAAAALAYTSVRELKRYYDTRAIVLSFMLVGTLGPLFLMAISDALTSPYLDVIHATFVIPEVHVWGYILAMGLTATIAQVLMTKAYGYSKAGVVGATSYSTILFGLVVGLVLGDGWPTFYILIGIVLIIVAGVLVAKGA